MPRGVLNYPGTGALLEWERGVLNRGRLGTQKGNADMWGAQAFMDKYGPGATPEQLKGAATEIALGAMTMVPSKGISQMIKGLKRNTKTGQYVGAPKGIDTPKKVKGLISNYMEKMNIGKEQRDWYDTGGQSIMKHAGDDPVVANKFAENLATTSTMTPVGSNTAHSVKAHNQAVQGLPVRTGMFPETMSPSIENIYHSGETTSGLKRTPFGQNLALGGGFRDVPNPRPVHDRWDMRAHGYQGEGGKPYSGTPGASNHEFLDIVDDAMINQANAEQLGGLGGWNELNAQAAAWAAERTGGNFTPGVMNDYAEWLTKHSAQGSRETIPGATTGHMPELAKAPRATQQLYDDEVAKIVYDAQGRDKIAMGNQALAGGHFQGPGIFNEAKTVPGRQTLTPVGSDPSVVGQSATGKDVVVRDVDPASRAIMDANESNFALAGGQDMYAWSKTDAAAKDFRSAYELNIPGGTISDAAAMKMMKDAKINPDTIAVVPTPTGVRIINLDLKANPAPVFDEIAKQASASLGIKRPTGVRPDGGFGMNDWNKPKGILGQQYHSQLGPRFDDLAPALHAKWRDLDKQFAKEYKFTVSDKMQLLRDTVANEGRAGMEKLVKKLGLPTASISALMAIGMDDALYGLSPAPQERGGL